MSAMMTTETLMTFDDVVALEPRLAGLLAEAKAEHAVAERDGEYCASTAWAHLKGTLAQLIGWYRPEYHSVLSSSAAYSAAAEAVSDALPACRDCGCP